MEKSKQSITIKKIKRDHKYRLTIEYEKMVDGRTTEYTARFDEEPAPELTQAFNRLSIAACQALEFGDVTNYAARVHVLAVAYGEKSDGREYAILTMRYRNPLSGSETTINTAQWPWPMTESEAKEPGFIDDRSGEQLNDLREEAWRYLAGYRAQQQLEFDKQDEDTPPAGGGQVVNFPQ